MKNSISARCTHEPTRENSFIPKPLLFIQEVVYANKSNMKSQLMRLSHLNTGNGGRERNLPSCVPDLQFYKFTTDV